MYTTEVLEMNYLHPLMRLSTIFSKTGVPLVVIASIFTLCIVLVELSLTQNNNNSKTILLSISQEEEYENNHDQISDFQFNTSGSSEASKNPYMGLIIDGINHQQFNDNILTTLTSIGIPDENLSASYITYFYLLIKRKSYGTVIDLLEKNTVDQRLRTGTQFYYALALSRKSLYEDSLLQYKALIDSNRNHQSATLNSAILLQKLKRYDEAIQYFSQSAEITSGIRKAKSLAGIAHCNKLLGKFSEAITYYQKSIEYRPADKVTWRLLADVMAISSQSFKTVINTYNKSISLDNNYTKAIENKAQYQLQQLDFYGALGTLKTDNKNSEASFETQMIRGWIYMELGKTSKGLRTLKHLKNYTDISNNSIKGNNNAKKLNHLRNFLSKDYLQFNNNDWNMLSPEILYLLALSNSKRHKSSLAIKQLNVLQQQPALSARARIAKARIYKTKKRYGDATNTYQTLLTNHPHSSTLWYESSKLQFKQHNAQLALTQIQHALDIQPNNKWYQLIQSDYLIAIKEHDKALAVLLSTQDQYPRSIKTLRRLAHALILTNKPSLAEDALEKIRGINPDDIPTLMLLAKTQYQRERYTYAEETLHNLLQIQQNNLDARFLLANISLEQGDSKKSLMHLRKLLKLEKTHQPALTLRDKITQKSRLKNTPNQDQLLIRHRSTRQHVRSS